MSKDRKLLEQFIRNTSKTTILSLFICPHVISNLSELLLFNNYTYKRVQWLFLAQFCQSGEKCWADVPAQVIFGSISHRNRFNHCWNRWQRQTLCCHILFTELIWTRLDLLTVGKHEPDLPLSSREGFTAMHSILQVTRAESRSQTDGDDVRQEEYFPDRENKYDCYIYYSMHNEYSFVAMTNESCDWFRHCN